MAEKQTPAPEPTNVPDPNPNPDADLIVGAPGQDPAKASEPAKPAAKAAKDDGLVEIKIGTETQRVSKETAALIQAQQDAFRKEFAALAQTTQRPAEPAPAPKPADDGPDWETMLLDDPKKFVGEMRKAIREEVMGEVQQTTSQQTQVQTFWNGFYQDHGDLKGYEDIVDSMMQRNQQALSMPGLTVAEASDKLADLTRRELLNIAKKFGGSKPEPKRDPTIVEGGGGPIPAAPAAESEPEPQEQVVHLGDVIRRRKAERRAGKQGAA